MHLHDALDQIGEIRARLEAADRFRGYRAAPVAASGLLAILAATAQSIWMPEPRFHVGEYLLLWMGVAAANVTLVVIVMAAMLRREPTPAAFALTRTAVYQFVPCCVTGGLLTVLFALHLREHAWLLPGLWQILFSQGVFASVRLLPKATFAVGAFYLLCGLAVLALARGDHAYSPWAMGLPFGLGQLLTAGLLYWTLERRDD